MWFSSKDGQGEAIQEDSERSRRPKDQAIPSHAKCQQHRQQAGCAWERELTLDTHLQLLEWVPKWARGLQGTLRELRAGRGLLPHSKIFKIPFHWEGRCSHKGYGLVIHTQGFLLPTTLLFCPGSLLAPSSAFFHSGRGAARSSMPVLPPPGHGLGGTGTQSHPRIAWIHNSQA